MSPTYLPPPNQHSGAAGIPATALAAAILWILFGAFMLFASVMLFAQGQVGVLQLLFGAAYVTIAIRVLCAKPAGLLGGGITSIVLGALFTMGAATAVSREGDTVALPALALAFGFGFAGLLIVAGVLACVAHRAYKTWRVARGSAANPFGEGVPPPQPTTHDDALLAQAPVCPSCRVAMSFDAESSGWRCDGCAR
jgi:hypothetical protein